MTETRRKVVAIGNRFAPRRFLLFIALLLGGYFAYRAAWPGGKWADAAAMAFDAAEPANVNRDAMAAAMGAVTTIEVTIAGATRTADGVAVTEGDAIVLVDGTLIANVPATRDALLAGLAHAEVSAGSLVTIYAGEGVSQEELAATAEAVGSRFAGAEVEALPGGQPLYPYIASIE